MPEIRTKKQNPVLRTIELKKKLIARLNREVDSERADCESRVKQIKFRVQMVQTLVDALEKGK